MRVAVVTEGTTDFLVIQAIVEDLIPGAEVSPIHPEVPLLAYPEYAAAAGGARLGTGWRGVRAWCQEYGDALELVLAVDQAAPFDVLIVHVDASMADKVNVERPCPPATATTDGLRLVVIRDWLGRHNAPGFLVLATPSKSTDAWSVAAVAPAHSNIECEPGIRGVLVARRLLPRRSGGIRTRYAALARRVAQNLTTVREVCSEADRFARDIEALAFP